MIVALALAGSLAWHGLRIGDLPVCRRNLISATVALDAEVGRGRLDLVLTPDAAHALATATATHVGQPLVVTVGRHEIARPIVLEPITRGEMSFSSPTVGELHRAARAARRPC